MLSLLTTFLTLTLT